MAFALSGSHSIICFRICGWSAVGPSNILQECIWGDNLGKQCFSALFPEQRHHQNFLKSKTKTQQSTKGSCPGQAETWRVVFAAHPPANTFLHLLQISHHTNLSWPKWGAEEIKIRIKQRRWSWEDLRWGQSWSTNWSFATKKQLHFIWYIWSDTRVSPCPGSSPWQYQWLALQHGISESPVNVPLSIWRTASFSSSQMYAENGMRLQGTLYCSI